MHSQSLITTSILIILEIVFIIAAPAFDILFIGCVLKIVYTTAETRFNWSRFVQGNRVDRHAGIRFARDFTEIAKTAKRKG